jgi:hypothetical protein
MKVTISYYIYLHCRRRSHEQPHEHQTSMDDGGQEGGQGGRRSGAAAFFRMRYMAAVAFPGSTHELILAR